MMRQLLRLVRRHLLGKEVSLWVNNDTFHLAMEISILVLCTAIILSLIVRQNLDFCHVVAHFAMIIGTHIFIKILRRVCQGV